MLRAATFSTAGKTREAEEEMRVATDSFVEAMVKSGTKL
jgi:hypothetical protein